MEDVKLNLDKNGNGRFYVIEGSELIAEMVVSIDNGHLTVYHTEVLSKAEGKGLAKKLLEAMVGYARHNRLQVIPLCPYVHAQFKRHPDEFADIWDAVNVSGER